MNVLIVDDEKSIRTSTAVAVRAAGYTVDTADNGAVALLKLQEDAYDLVFLDLRLGDEDGLAVLDQIKRQSPQVAVVVFTAYATVASAVSAIQRGATDYLEKPFTLEHLRQLLSRVEKQRRLETRINDLQEQVQRTSPDLEITSRDPQMQGVLDVLLRAAPTQAPVLLLGESGTGKSALARVVHAHSAVGEGPFVTVSCPSLTRELLESELFGHVKGAFTGAIRDSWGKVAAAESGTLFLDEIGELPLEIQPKLLRLLHERQYERLGEHKTRVSNVRIIAATNKDLKEAVRRGNFREDLYYRLDVISVFVPPLRERRADLLPLADGFLAFYGVQLGREGLSFSTEATKQLEVYSWPGNIRELKNTVERAVILSREPVIGPQFIPVEAESDDSQEDVAVGANVTLDSLEEAHIRKVLRNAASLDSAAKILGIDPATLYRKRKRLNL
ncbi:MAG: sigma-54-dependent Fis family transcriptional regulator [Verrucomicrobia bacterium]|nr:sigma-54-dependent Fis family transcriptional regulator [Verrucomicrobiota bacterium]